ncbi:ribonuclease H-like YkuK family protein [Proteinivorax hydrogeniformans]|uniref:Ribonuclease H-like YkuK family protein n=1 Tax=Proteinivorax hydrogeniformans TaxID=1826727 RepID=A0AAU8HSK3_9FIRM
MSIKSITHGDVSFKQVCKLITDYIKADLHQDYELTIGTDSQNSNSTKAVIVIALRRIGKGGIFFYDIKRVKKITNIKKKIYYETSLSLDVAQKLMKYLDVNNLPYSLSIHVDIGKNGPTSEMIPEIVGWVRGCGFDCEIKPEATTASAIANKYSK